MKVFKLLKIALPLAFMLGFATNSYASPSPSSYDCYGTYDRYDDTCYNDNGDYTHYNYSNGHRNVFRDGRRIGNHRYNNGSYGGWYPRGGGHGNYNRGRGHNRGRGYYNRGRGHNNRGNGRGHRGRGRRSH